MCFIMWDARGNFLAPSSTVSVSKQYCGIALMYAQSLLCSCDNRVYFISFEGTILKTLTVLSDEHGSLLSLRHILMLSNSGYFWLSDENVRYCYSVFAETFQNQVWTKIFIYIGDNNHNCIYWLTAGFDKLHFIEGNLKPRALAVSNDGAKFYLTEIDSGILKVSHTT